VGQARSVKDDESMSSEADRSPKLSSFEQLRYARQILHLESRTLAQLAELGVPILAITGRADRRDRRGQSA